jgi:hypothetical protein
MPTPESRVLVSTNCEPGRLHRPEKRQDLAAAASHYRYSGRKSGKPLITGTSLAAQVTDREQKPALNSFNSGNPG